jgi:hypothetical protein
LIQSIDLLWFFSLNLIGPIHKDFTIFKLFSFSGVVFPKF